MDDTDPGQTALVIGYGSPIRGDDALGPLVAERLGSMGLPSRVHILARHILTAELVDDLSAVDRVIFIDAAVDLPAGEIHCRRVEPDAGVVSSMAHFHDPRELLAWSQALYDRAPEAWLVSAGGAQWDYASYELSGAARTAIEPIIRSVLQLLGLSGQIAPWSSVTHDG